MDIRLSPGFLTGLAVALWAVVPNLVAKHHTLYIVEALSIGLLICAIASLPGRRWNLPTTLASVYVLTTSVSVVHYGALSDLGDGLVTGMLIVFSTLAASNFSRTDVERMIRVILWVAAAELALGAAEIFGHVKAPYGDLGAAGSVFGTNNVVKALGGRVTGSMGQPLPYGTFMAIAAMLAFFGLRRSGLLTRLILGLAFAGGTIISGSRGPTVAIIAGIVVAFVFNRELRHRVLVRIIVVLAALIAVFYANADGIVTRSGLTNTGSLTHRLGAIDSIPDLIQRSGWQTFFGSGYNSTHELFALGLLQTDGFTAVDNQFVQSFAAGGLIGFGALAALGVLGLIRGHGASRPAAFALFGMFLGFDALQWYSTMTLFFVLIAAQWSRPDSKADAGAQTVLSKPGTGVSNQGATGARMVVSTGADRGDGIHFDRG